MVMHTSSYCLLIAFILLPFSNCEIIRDYYFDVTKRTWSEARDYCNEYHDGLATILTSTDFNNAKYAIPTIIGHPVTQIWIGLNDIDIEGIWSWDDKTPCSYNPTIGGHDCSDFWLANEPNDYRSNEDCGQLWLYNGQWKFNDGRCSYTIPTLCNIEYQRSYIWNGTFRNWTESEKYCNENHGGMATIQTSEEYIDSITNIPAGATEVWIGLHDINTEGKWEWSNKDEKCLNNSNITHDCSPFWAENEPNDYKTGEDCGEFRLYDGVEWLINDMPCRYHFGVLCTEATTPRPTTQPTPDRQNARFAYSGELRTWADGLVYCERNYVGLATITTMTELDDAIRLIPFNDKYNNLYQVWIGLNDIKTEGIWEWSDGSKCQYMNGTVFTGSDCSDLWFDNEPNDYQIGEDCGELRYNSGQWKFNDISCDSARPVLCTKNLSTTAPTTSFPTGIPTVSPTMKPSKHPLNYPTVTYQPTNAPTITVTETDDKSASSSSSSKTAVDVVLILIILILVIVLAIAVVYLLKFRKMINLKIQRKSVAKFQRIDDDQEKETESNQDTMDIQLVENDQMKNTIN